jgi:EAL domain-containing protein (putative c-di-GMP-specific phosphodiesterase class I)
MTTVAEGVETRAQLEYLKNAGCDESQGYLHSRPLPKTEFEQWIFKSMRNFKVAGPATANGSTAE